MILVNNKGDKIIINDEGVRTYKNLLYNNIMRLKQIEDNLTKEQEEELNNDIVLYNQIVDYENNENNDKKHTL